MSRHRARPRPVPSGVRPWYDEHGIVPDLVTNSHAHIMEFGVYPLASGDLVPAATSGSQGWLLCRDECGEDARGPEGSVCGDGQLWGASEYGYAVVDIWPDLLQVTYKDVEGNDLFCWQRTHEDPEGEVCE
ncbi:MAG: hypothetical protein JRJ84_22460 [Deltaproteobacteria bacterium]|nr:hypothetical protein [Deltaproteobacteria bacterium]